MSIVKGNYRIFLRIGTLDDLMSVFVIPGEYIERLRNGWDLAVKEADIISNHQKKLHGMRNLSPGSYVVRTDSGEIIAEAERIIKGEGDTEG